MRVVSDTGVQSSIVLKNFNQRATSLFGFKVADKPVTSLEKKSGIQFVKVDLGNPAYKINRALLGSVVRDNKMSTTLEKLFNSWLSDTSIGYEDIRDRQARLNELYFMYTNDAFIARACHLVADEATQPDSQKRLLVVEAGDKAFVKKVYELLNMWGVTQNRLHGTCFDINLYGESFWLNRVTSKGVESIKPIDPNIITERLEFNPIKVADFLAKKTGENVNAFTKQEKVKKLLAIYKDESLNSEDQIADIFETKNLGYELQGNLFVPPWSITHFRYNADRSEFYPYGRPPLLPCLAPFRLTLATKTLQGLARAMSFPLVIYKVKSSELLSPQDTYHLVEETKEQYDAVTLNPAQAANEVYALNTKIWIPEGLVDVEVKDMKIDLNLTDDLEMYQDQTIVAAAIPKGYLVQEWGGFGNSAISLVEQFKPFARYTYSIQSIVLEELSWLIRLHFAITGEFDYNTPFMLSMRFPADETSTDSMGQKTTNIDMCKAIIELVQQALGVDSEETLPEDVITDILSQYSFIDSGYLSKWAQSVSYKKFTAKSEDEDEDDDSFGEYEDDAESGGSDFGGFDDASADVGEEVADDAGGGEPDGELAAQMEALIFNKKRFREVYKRSNDKTRSKLKSFKEKKLRRLQEIQKRFDESNKDIFLKFLESENIKERSDAERGHMMLAPKVCENKERQPYFEILCGANSNKVLRENKKNLKQVFQEVGEREFGPSKDVLTDVIANIEKFIQ